MTATEFRNHKEYKICIDKVKSYPKDFEFTLNWSTIPKAKGNALKIVMRDCIEMGLLKSVSTGLNLKGEVVSDTYRKV